MSIVYTVMCDVCNHEHAHYADRCPDVETERCEECGEEYCPECPVITNHCSICDMVYCDHCVIDECPNCGEEV